MREADRLQKVDDFVHAVAALKRAQDRLGNDGPAEPNDRLARASQNLQLVTRLDSIRLNRVLAKRRLSKMPAVVEAPEDDTPTGRQYEAAFREVQVGTVGEDPAAAARVVASPAARPWLPPWTTGRLAPAIGTSARGCWRWRGPPTRTAGATASVTP